MGATYLRIGGEGDPHIGKKPSPLSPYILHLYQQNGSVNEAEENALTIAEDEVAYKLGPEIKPTEAGIEESLSDPTVLELPHALPTPDSRKTTAPQFRDEASPSKEPH